MASKVTFWNIMHIWHTFKLCRSHFIGTPGSPITEVRVYVQWSGKGCDLSVEHLPELMAASVWIAPGIGTPAGDGISLPNPLTTCSHNVLHYGWQNKVCSEKRTCNLNKEKSCRCQCHSRKNGLEWVVVPYPSRESVLEAIRIANGKTVLPNTNIFRCPHRNWGQPLLRCINLKKKKPLLR